MNANKRLKTSSSCKQSGDIKKYAIKELYYGYTLDTLPPEVLEVVLRLLPLEDVATAIRLVSRRCLTVATIVLNSSFLAAGKKLENIVKHVTLSMSKRKKHPELLIYSRTINILELIRAQYKMLKAVTWRYTHPPKQQKFSRLSFYAGRLLDDLNSLLRRAVNNPASLFDSHGPDICVTCFLADCKRFMNYFEKVSERRINKSALVSGCKAVDILDCLAEGRQLLSFRILSGREIENDIVSMKLKYVMKRAWFTCLEVPRAPDENSWRDEQRFMYLRLRRLVGSVNEHYFEKINYERLLLLQSPLARFLRPPSASTYSGYGEYGGRFFYYGNMNKCAYENKFKVVSMGDWEDAIGETKEEVRETPCFDLSIVVELRCSPELAPFVVRKTLKTDELDLYRKASYHQEIYLKLSVMCPASKTSRLPANFTWKQHAYRRTRFSS